MINNCTGMIRLLFKKLIENAFAARSLLGLHKMLM